MTKTALVVGIALVGFTSRGGYSAPTATEEYELQERCGKRVDQVFTKNFEGGVTILDDGTTITAIYRNHYNKKLNKCFYIVTSTTTRIGDKTEATALSTTLFDVNENKEYGNLYSPVKGSPPTVCRVAGTPCSSKPEWDALVRPYMEE